MSAPIIVYAIAISPVGEWMFTIHQRANENDRPGILLNERTTGTGAIAKEVAKKIVADGNGEIYEEICDNCQTPNHTNVSCPVCQEFINARSDHLKIMTLEDTNQTLKEIAHLTEQSGGTYRVSSDNNGATGRD